MEDQPSRLGDHGRSPIEIAHRFAAALLPITLQLAQQPMQHQKYKQRLQFFQAAGVALGVSSMLGANSIYGFPPVPGGALGGGIGGALGGGLGYVIGRGLLGSPPEDVAEETVDANETAAGDGNLSAKQIVIVVVVVLLLGSVLGLGAMMLGL